LFYSIFKVQQAKMLGDPTIIYQIFIQPIIFTLLFGYLYKSSGKEGAMLVSVFIGVGQMTMWQVLLYAGGIIVRHEFNRERTIFYSLLSQTDLFGIWAKRLFLCILLTTPSFLIAILTGVTVFNVSIDVTDLTYMVISVLLYLVSLYGIGLPIILLLFLTVHGGKIIQTVTYPMFLLSGMIVSVDHFPDLIKGIAFLFPITWSTHWIQDVFVHNKVDWSFLCFTLVISVFYALLARYIYHIIMNKVRVRGEINL
jgi:ABC-2 type transport system permease protein